MNVSHIRVLACNTFFEINASINLIIMLVIYSRTIFRICIQHMGQDFKSTWLTASCEHVKVHFSSSLTTGSTGGGSGHALLYSEDSKD